MRDHYEPVVAQKAKLAVQGIKKRALAGNADLMQWWTFLATDTVGELGFGESFGMLEKGEVSLVCTLFLMFLLTIFRKQSIFECSKEH